MKKAIIILAAVLALGGIGTWFVTGAHRGWSRTSVQTVQVDEVTGIETPVYRDGFVAGVDFLGATLLGSVLLAGLSLFFRKKSSTPESI